MVGKSGLTPPMVYTPARGEQASGRSSAPRSGLEAAGPGRASPSISSVIEAIVVPIPNKVRQVEGEDPLLKRIQDPQRSNSRQNQKPLAMQPVWHNWLTVGSDIRG